MFTNIHSNVYTIVAPNLWSDPRKPGPNALGDPGKYVDINSVNDIIEQP